MAQGRRQSNALTPLFLTPLLPTPLCASSNATTAKHRITAEPQAPACTAHIQSTALALPPARNACSAGPSSEEKLATTASHALLDQ
jgi:hypothetical protein